MGAQHSQGEPIPPDLGLFWESPSSLGMYLMIHFPGNWSWQEREDGEQTLCFQHLQVPGTVLGVLCALCTLIISRHTQHFLSG